MNDNLVNSIVRYNPEPNKGLTSIQVKNRIDKGLINFDTSIPTKSIKEIIKENFITLFNIVNLILALALLYVGSFRNMFFIGVVISNLIIGTYQEIASKKTVDKLSIISSSKVKTIRDGKIKEIAVNDIVLDDIILFSSGNQIVADCIVVDNECSVNESLITGESDSILKKPGDMLLSGSYVVSGQCTAKVEHIGDDNYASKISKDAKYIKQINSEIMKTFKKIVLIISIIIVPIGVLLFLRQLGLENITLKTAVEHTVGGIVSMIPEGLVLLTSSVLAVSVIRLAKHKVLVQEIYCIETLARVDVLCLDKTGTITEGHMEVSGLVTKSPFSQEEITKSLSFLTAALNDTNPTFTAIKQKYQPTSTTKIIKSIPFSSERKWSGASFEGIGSYIIGASEFVLGDQAKEIEKEINRYTEENRVLVLAHTSDVLKDDQIPKNLKVMGFVLIKDRIRSNAKDTLEYFAKQDVDIKIISGDNVLTVANIARRAGLKSADNYIDASTLKTEEEIKQAAVKYSVFGRVTPMQKKQIIVALKEQGHTVAMTGDGVNDVLALKEADCSIAMAAGSDAARNVSQLVLLNSNFDSMPKVVEEGRRSINNIQRSSSLFLVKTIYATILSILFLFINYQYPFKPLQATLINVFMIGIPSFILALEPNHERIKGKFFMNIIMRSIPGALTIIVNLLLVVLAQSLLNEVNAEVASTLSVILTGFASLMLLHKICVPFDFSRKLLFIFMSVGFTIGVLFFRSFFNLATLTPILVLILAVLMFVSFFVFKFITKIFEHSHLLKKYKNI